MRFGVWARQGGSGGRMDLHFNFWREGVGFHVYLLFEASLIHDNFKKYHRNIDLALAIKMIAFFPKFEL